MSKVPSFDLRDRTIVAVEGGMSCRQSAARFGGSASRAIRWRFRLPARGDMCDPGRGATTGGRDVLSAMPK
jgi:transposase